MVQLKNGQAPNYGMRGGSCPFTAWRWWPWPPCIVLFQKVQQCPTKLFHHRERDLVSRLSTSTFWSLLGWVVSSHLGLHWPRPTQVSQPHVQFQRLMRWSLILQPFCLQIVHVRGKDNVWLTRYLDVVINSGNVKFQCLITVPLFLLRES